ncbi:MAG: SRPBCC family protein, partial [Cyanobacteria bacterium P01_D01_bin.73]
SDRPRPNLKIRTRPRCQEWKSWNFFKNFKGDKYNTGDADDPLASGNFMAEDIYVCEQQQRSFKSPYFSVGAIAKDLERSVYQYQRNVQEFMTAAAAKESVSA